ncbi:MAG: MFS transporter [Thermoleophilaceae bacterium]
MDVSRVKRLTLVASILGSSVVFLDGSVVNVALPAIRDDLHVSQSTQQWVVEGYLLTLSSLILIGGSLGDLLGRRRVFLWGLIGFGITSILCAAAPNGAALVAARAVQGVAGALLVPSSLALITATYPEDERGAAIGTWTAWTGVAFVIGPLAGGVLIDAISWRLVFAINIPLVIATVMVVRAGVQESGLGAHQPIDYTGALLGMLGLAGPTFGLTEQATYGWSDPRVWAPIVIGLLLLAAFVVYESRTPYPMLPLDLFKRRNFTVANLTTLTLYAGLGALTFFLVLFLQQVAGYSAIQGGLALLPVTIVMFSLSRRFGALSMKVGPRWLMGGGPLIAALGFVLLMRVDASVNYFTDVLPAVLVFSLGLSMTVAPLTTTVLQAVEPEHAGVASGVNNAISRLAGLLGIAIIGAVIAAQFASSIDSQLSGQRLTPAERRIVVSAKQTPLAGEKVVPPAQRPKLGPKVEDATVKAFRFGLAASAVLVALGGVVSLVGLREHRRRRRERAAAPVRAPGQCIDCGFEHDAEAPHVAAPAAQA